MLTFCAKAAVAYHLHLCSLTPFVFGDEETVMSTLAKVVTASLISANEPAEHSGWLCCHRCSCFKQESALFMDEASSVFRRLSGVVSSFSNEQGQREARRLLEKTHRPQNISTSLRKHDSVTGDGAPVTSGTGLTLLLMSLLIAEQKYRC